MRVLLVTRGSQGDIYPYLTIASELVRRGHDVTLNLPQMFEEHAKAYHLNYVLQDPDDIESMVDSTTQQSKAATPYLKWMRNVIDMQFRQLPSLLDKHDILVATNSEFAAASIAEYCRKPFVRTAFGPFIPGKRIPPPVFPFPKPNPVFTPGMIWKLLNVGSNYMSQKAINKNRKLLGLKPLKNSGYYAAEAAHNYLLYSRYLGNIDPDWKCRWEIGGYCFNDTLRYDEEAYRELQDFIRKDQRPVLFFTLGSCSAKNSDAFCNRLVATCEKLDYRLIVGSGWSQIGSHLRNTENVFLMKRAIPHSLIFPDCNAVMHHGGAGTTHSVARAGCPQLILPLILDQPYWGYRISQLKIGPEVIKIAKVSDRELEEKVRDLVANPLYKENAKALAEKIRAEKSVDNVCDFIERVGEKSLQ